MPFKNKEKTNSYIRDRHLRLKVDAVAYKGGKCIDCGFVGHPACFDFHHRNPEEKDFQWTKLKKQSWDRILIELDKCDLLCACCHRVKHANPYTA